MTEILDEKNLPYWLDMLWEDADRRSNKILEIYSAKYRKLKERKKEIMQKYPELIPIVEADELHQNLVLDEIKRKKLAELGEICMDIMWLHQKIFYVLGLYDGMKLSEFLHQIDEKTE